MIAILLASIVNFGAICDGLRDDTAAIQATLNAAAADGDEVYIPRGRCVVSRAGTAYYALRADGIVIGGDGPDASLLVQAPGSGQSVRTLYVTGADAAVYGVGFDGQRARQTADEHRAAIFAEGATGLVLSDIAARDSSGDGIYFYTGVAGASLDRVIATGNGRNGLTMGSTVTDVSITASTFAGNAAQQIDSEPGGAAVVSGVVVSGCKLDGAGASGDYVLTISGTGAATPGHGWRVIDNEINGGVMVVWAERVVIAGNRGFNFTDKPSIDIQRSSAEVRVVGNDLAAARAAAVVSIVGTAGSGPSVLVAGNRLSAGGGFGVRAMGAVSLVVAGNDIYGPGPSAVGSAGVYLRATVPERDFAIAAVGHNLISGFERGIAVAGNGAARLLQLELVRNQIGAASAGMSLDDGTGALQAALIRGNTIAADVARGVINVPPAAAITWGGWP